MNEYDTRQYNSMLRVISSYKNNEIRLSKLINDLEGLLECLEEKESVFEDQFLRLWSELEIIYAMSLDREDKNFTESEVKSLIESADKIEKLVRKQIANSDRHD